MIIKPPDIQKLPTAIISITKNGKELGEKISTFFPNSKIFYNSKNLDESFKYAFKHFNNIIAIMATGIVVRKIAPLLVSKLKDPAVVVLDEKGKFAIPLLSGHWGRANELSLFFKESIGSIPVITTATDVNKKFSIDTLCRYFSWHIENSKKIKDINLAFLNNEKIITNISKDFLIENNFDKIPSNLIFVKELRDVITSKIKNKIVLSNIKNLKGEFLLIRPKNIYIGLGCNRGTSFKEIETVILTFMDKLNKSIYSINSISSIDIKSNEEGILHFAEKYKVRAIFYSKEELNSVNETFEISDYTIKKIGVKGVCEPSAILSASRDMQKCLKRKKLLPKQKTGNVTIAIQELNFL